MTTEDTAPDEPEEHALRFVPVRTTGPVQVLRLFRHRDGSRCAVAFRTAAALHDLLGPDQEAAELTEPALRALTAPLGVHRLVLDPGLVAPQPAGAAAAAALPCLPGTGRQLERRT